jgi:hypothetical protein
MRRLALPVLLAPLLFAAGCDLGEIEHVGTITRVEHDGGFWGIVTADGERFRPTNLPVEFEREGMEVEFEGYVLDEERADDEWGIPVRLTEVEVQLAARDD